MKIDNKEIKISYPCSWSYKVIGPDKELVQQAVSAVFSGREYSLSYANASRTGKYHSWSITIEVINEHERNSMFTELKNHPHIKVVI